MMEPKKYRLRLIGVGIGIGVDKVAGQLPIPTPKATPTPRDMGVLTYEAINHSQKSFDVHNVADCIPEYGDAVAFFRPVCDATAFIGFFYACPARMIRKMVEGLGVGH